MIFFIDSSPYTSLYQKAKFPSIKFTNYDAAVLIGFHAAQGIKSPFAHTFRNEISKIFLREENVGEVTLLVKWLQSNNVPILFVHGESELKNEVKKLNIPFISNLTTPYIPQNVNLQKTEYIDTSPIKVKLKNNKLLDAFPTKLFNVEKNFLLFFNIAHLFANLSFISIFLNAARNYYTMYLKNIFNQIKWNYSLDELKNINDKRLNNILDSSSITDNDLEYVRKKLKI